MKKTKSKLSKVSKTPPPGWPTEEEWAEIEKELEDKPASYILSPDAGPVDTAKYELCGIFMKYFKKEGITQRELAKRLDVTENRVSEILHYHYQKFTIDRLIELLSRIKPNIKIKVA